MMISVIVPVYNVEPYLRQCINSILTQSFRDFELILVDDGSRDASLLICDEYAGSDIRVKVIRQKNGGAGSARNTGIKASSGEYVLFVDSDDYIEEGSLEKIMKANEADGACDIVFLKSVYVLPDGKHTASYNLYDKGNFYKRSRAENLSYLAKRDPLPVCLWDKLIRRSLLTDNDIAFTEGIICEDVDFCIKLYMHAKTYNYIDVQYYYYRKDRVGSVMNINTSRKFHDLHFIVSKWAVLAQNDYKQYAGELYQILAFQYSMLLGALKYLPKKERAEHKRSVAGLSWLLDRSRDKRVRLLNVSVKIGGITGAACLLNFYNRLKRLTGGA